MKKVNVLMSSYNGETYIREQIESILGQKHVEVVLYVRDDGSSDGTLDILREYESAGKLILEAGENLGFAGSFLRLVKICGDADYYAYSDQDDVWMPEKLYRAVRRLDREAKDVPVLCFTNYEFCDAELNVLSQASPVGKPKAPSFVNALVECMPLGFNIVFNHCARKMISQNQPKHAHGHDCWTYLLCAGLGRVVYDSHILAKYRRTGSNVSAGGASFFKLQIWRFQKFFLGDYFDRVKRMLREFECYYGNSLSEKDRRVLALFTGKRYNLRAALTKTFYPHRFRQTIPAEIMVRMIFLLGKL